MRIKFLSSIILIVLVVTSCNKKDLALQDPVSPTIGSINSEAGVVPFALGMWSKFSSPEYWVAAHTHSVMGDEAFIPWGNYNWRWTSQVYKITLPDGTVVNNPIGPEQKLQLQSTNSREAGEYNTFKYEWTSMYYTIASANTLLSIAKAPAFTFSGDAATKQKVLKAWAYWWRGWAYSRIGSIYIAGLVNNQSGASSFISNQYVTNAAIITEANANLDSAITTLSGLTANDTYNTLMGGGTGSIVPSFCNTKGIVNPDNWVRLCNTMKARNLLVNKKNKNATASDWAAVQSLATNGLKAGDVTFTVGFTTDGINDILGAWWVPSIMLSDNNGGGGWLFCSERLIQEYKAGDARFARNFISDYGIVLMNPRSRGIQYGTVYHTIDAEDGGTFTTKDNTTNVQSYIAPSYEENELMLAEAKINQSNIDAGLVHVDNVRSYQNASLSNVSGTGLTATQAKEELRRERRVALFMRGTAFYDARRWNVTAPVADGGGRANANVLVPSGFGTYTTSAIRPCFMEYRYMDYFDVPKDELDFNPASATSVAVKQ